jgi:hypothetical protein
MKQRALGLAIATVAFAGSSLYLWTQLRQERAYVAQVEETGRQLNARIAELEKARGQIALNVTPGGGVGSSPPGNRPATQQAPPGMAGNHTPPRPDEMTPDAREAWKTMARPEFPPAALKMMRAGNRAHNRRQYGEFAREIGLSQEKTSQLIDLLTDQQMAGFTETRNFNDATDMQHHFADLQRDNEAAIADLIGADKAAQLKEYQQSAPARMEFEMLAQQLDGSDAPLSTEQQSKLLALFIEERNRIPPPEYTASAGGLDYVDAFNEWHDDFEQRFRSQASRVFSSEQLSAYNEIQQAQKEMRDQNGGFSAVSMPLGAAVQGDVVTYATSSGNAAFVSGAVVSAPAPPPAAPKKKP